MTFLPAAREAAWPLLARDLIKLGGGHEAPSELELEPLLDRMRSGEGTSRYDGLTDREREILVLIAEGHTNAQIADRLFISRRTVETHRANLMRKLGLRTQTDLISYALRRGILPME